ncbi:putative HTH-type transcriptional regulator YdfL [Vallitalea longa]|uniref:HTH-type transcriptional regulator YdfL n=1 Tax=Vallitalea longa TaxID=2936439 RepID=A0A9W6DF45_9FIRM|nr:MerR family transcriptional regulator [Vallitalea longa]GKX29102.1 putative HTH-type transcriptional regulator YdfL [Vallitalea longa]
MNKSWQTGEMAKLKGLSKQAIRYYERRGIIKPEYIDKKNNYRYYSNKQFVEFSRLKFLQILGFSLSEINDFYALDNIEDSVSTLHDRKSDFDALIRKLQYQQKEYEDVLQRLDNALKHIKNGNTPIHIIHDFELKGITISAKRIKDWNHFNEAQLEIEKKHPLDTQDIHHYNLVYEFDLKRSKAFNNLYDANYFYDNHVKSIMKMTYSSKGYPNPEVKQIGDVIFTYHFGHPDLADKSIERIQSFAEYNGLEITGSVFIIKIGNRFITDNIEDTIWEVYVPVN